MSPLFGRGGGNKSTDSNNTEPAVLDFGGNKDEVKERIKSSNQSRNSPSYNNDRNSGSYNSTSTEQRYHTNEVDDFADISEIDKLQDTELKALRKKRYFLSNKEHEFELEHKNDFNNIVKYIIVFFASLIGLGFIAIIATIAYTSFQAGEMTETGTITSLLQFIADIIKIILS